MFAVLGLDSLRLSFKCTPEKFAELVELDDIDPSPYLGRYNWVKLDRLDAVRWEELRDLLRQSYEMIASKAMKKKAVSNKKAAKKNSSRLKSAKKNARKI